MRLFACLGRTSLACALAMACASAPSEPAAPPSAATTQSAAASPPRAPAAPSSASPSEAAVESTSAAEGSSANAESGSAAAAEPAPESDRTIKYMVSPEGLRVVVEGVTFTPKAELVRSGNGWGIKLNVQARTQDEAPRSLLAPVGAELAFAGQIRRKDGGSPEQFSDRREGDRELMLSPGKTVKLSRSWPPNNGPSALGPGDELTLEVGLWGLGADAESRRPVGKLCRVEVKFDKDKPRVKVTAPTGIPK